MKTIVEFIVNGGLAYVLIELSGVEWFSTNYWLMALSIVGLLVFNSVLGWWEGINR